MCLLGGGPFTFTWTRSLFLLPASEVSVEIFGVAVPKSSMFRFSPEEESGSLDTASMEIGGKAGESLHVELRALLLILI